MKELRYSWDEYHQMVETLATLIENSGWKFDSILCLSRGGLRPGDILSRIYDMPLNILATSSYRQAAGTVQGQLDIGKYIASSKPNSLKGKVLLVDDLVDSGLTFQKVIDHIKRDFPAVTEVKTAVIWWKACSVVTPDFYIQYLDSNPWIQQPFEIYDGMQIDEVIERVKGYNNCIIKAPEK